MKRIFLFVLDAIKAAGLDSIGVGKIFDIFAGRGTTDHTGEYVPLLILGKNVKPVIWVPAPALRTLPQPLRSFWAWSIKPPARALPKRSCSLKKQPQGSVFMPSWGCFAFV